MNHKTDNPSILIIYTGGTIGMVRDQVTGVLRPLDLKSLYADIPVLEKFACNLEFTAFDPLLDSSSISPDHWIKLAGIIKDNYEAYDGFVVLHGSDTMAFTASAVSFMLENLNKPVIFTGSQLPLGMLRTDGRENFITSIDIAATQEDETPLIPEVAIYFENRLLRGNRTTKFNAEDFEAFISGNYPALAEAGIEIRFNRQHIIKPNFKKLKVHTNLDTDVGSLRLYPGISRGFIKSALETPNLKGLVLQTFGSGNAMMDDWFVELLGKHIKQGLVVLNVSQCLAGSVNMTRYETGLKLKDLGVISGADITFESAIAKMMYLFGAGYDKSKVEELLVRPLRGELSYR